MDSIQQEKQALEALIEHPFKIICVEKTTSTNDEARRIALTGEKVPLVYIAQGQSAGRGSKGRSFFSPRGTGIYMSILLYPDLAADLCPLITPMCAAALARAIEKVMGIKAHIKWVNDIYLQGKKVAGILTEGSFTHKGAEYIIVGIGINLSPPEKGFPEELRDIAGSLTEGSEDLRCRLIAETVNCFMSYFEEIESRSFLPFYKSRLFFLGKEITVVTSQESYKAVATDIDSMCRLKIRTTEGEEKALSSGEISIRPL